MLNQGYKIPRLSYNDVKTIMEKKLAGIRVGISDEEIAKVVKELEGERKEEDFDPEIVSREVKKLSEKFERYNVPALEDLEEEREDGMFRILYGQMNSVSSKEVQEVKVNECTQIVNHYNINLVTMK